MKADDSRYDPCCARCVWCDEFYEGHFFFQLYCTKNMQHLRKTRPDHVCEQYQEEP